jgi:hypothetical protein
LFILIQRVDNNGLVLFSELNAAEPPVANGISSRRYSIDESPKKPVSLLSPVHSIPGSKYAASLSPTHAYLTDQLRERSQVFVYKHTEEPAINPRVHLATSLSTSPSKEKLSNTSDIIESDSDEDRAEPNLSLSQEMGSLTFEEYLVSDEPGSPQRNSISSKHVFNKAIRPRKMIDASIAQRAATNTSSPNTAKDPIPLVFVATQAASEVFSDDNDYLKPVYQKTRKRSSSSPPRQHRVLEVSSSGLHKRQLSIPASLVAIAPLSKMPSKDTSVNSSMCGMAPSRMSTPYRRSVDSRSSSPLRDFVDDAVEFSNYVHSALDHSNMDVNNASTIALAPSAKSSSLAIYSNVSANRVASLKSTPAVRAASLKSNPAVYTATNKGSSPLHLDEDSDLVWPLARRDKENASLLALSPSSPKSRASSLLGRSVWISEDYSSSPGTRKQSEDKPISDMALISTKRGKKSSLSGIPSPKSAHSNVVSTSYESELAQSSDSGQASSSYASSLNAQCNSEPPKNDETLQKLLKKRQETALKQDECRKQLHTLGVSLVPLADKSNSLSVDLELFRELSKTCVERIVSLDPSRPEYAKAIEVVREVHTNLAPCISMDTPMIRQLLEDYSDSLVELVRKKLENGK